MTNMVPLQYTIQGYNRVSKITIKNPFLEYSFNTALPVQQ